MGTDEARMVANGVKLLEHNSDAQRNWGGCDDTRDVLKVGEVYEVLKWEEHSWHTKVILKEFPDKKFASVCFGEEKDEVTPRRGG